MILPDEAATDRDKKYVVGVDFGGTGTRFVAVGLDGNTIGRTDVATPRETPDDDFVEFFADHIAALQVHGSLAGIGIGASGPIDADGIIRNPDTLPALTGVNIVGALRERFAVPVVIDNDAVVAAVAESRYGAAIGSTSLLHVTLGTGIGTCLLLGGRPLRGSDGGHPEGGHLGVGRAAPCYCGRAACWEQIASRSVLQASAEVFLGGQARGQGALEEVAARAEGGDRGARAIFEGYGADVGEGVATLLGLYRPALVILGGSAARFFRLYERPLRECLSATAQWHAPHRIATTTLDDFGGAIGAAALVTDVAGR